MQAKSEQKTTSAQAEQPEFIPTMLDFPGAQKSLKSRIPRAATTLKQTQGQTKKITYANIIKDKPVTATTQKPVNNKQKNKIEEPANKEITKTGGPVNKAQPTNSTETPQQSEPREATATHLRASCNDAHRSNATIDSTVLCQRNKSQTPHSSNDSIHSESTEETGDDALRTNLAKALEGADLLTEFKIVHWNAQGLNSKLHILESTIRNHNLDAMLVHDTRIEERENGRPPVKIHGYHTFYKPKDNMCHGFITIVRNRFPAVELHTLRPGTHSDLLTVKV